MIDVAVLRALVGAGASAEMIVAAVEAAQIEEGKAITERRAKAAERKRRSRAKSRTVTQSHNASQVVTLGHGDDCDQSSPLSLTSSLSESSTDSQESKNGVNGRARASRLPVDWRPSHEGWVFAFDTVADRAKDELAKFKDYWAARAGAGARKMDWDATWRTWIRRAAEHKGSTNGRHGKQNLSEVADDLIARARDLESQAGIGKRNATPERDDREGKTIDGTVAKGA